MGCEDCALRANYDKKPGSLLGRLWRWHAGWCPGFRGYLRSLSDDEQATLRRRYALKG